MSPGSTKRKKKIKARLISDFIQRGNHLNWAGHRFALTMHPSRATLGGCIPIIKYMQRPLLTAIKQKAAKTTPYRRRKYSTEVASIRCQESEEQRDLPQQR